MSITVRLTQPETDNPCQYSRSGVRETRLRWGFSPNSPQYAAGLRIEPAPSVAWAIAHRPAAVAAPLPPLEPPQVRDGSHGLRVSPQVGLSVNP